MHTDSDSHSSHRHPPFPMNVLTIRYVFERKLWYAQSSWCQEFSELEVMQSNGKRNAKHKLLNRVPSGD